MKKYFLLTISLILSITLVLSYTAPSYDNVIGQLCGSYSVSSYDNVIGQLGSDCGDSINPNAILLSPLNNTLNSSTSFNFTANLTDNSGLKNATLKIFDSLGNLYNQTSTTFAGIISTVWGNVVNLIDDVYTWFVNLFDTSDNEFSTSNFTLTVDSTNPNLNITYPINNSYTTNAYLNINYTTSDIHLDSCWYSNDSYSINKTLIDCGNLTSEINQTWLEFNGLGDDVSFGNNDLFKPSLGNRSFIIWAKPYKTANQALLSKGKGGAYEFELQLQSTGKVNLLIYQSSGAIHCNTILGAAQSYTLNQWQLFYGEFINTTSCSISVNSKAKSTSSTLTNLPGTGTANLKIGERDDGSNDFNGSVNSMIFYNQSLPIKQLIRIYNESELGSNMGKSIPVLSYHSIDADCSTDVISTCIGNFTNQMTYLNNSGYHSITYEDWYNYVNNHKSIPEKSFIIVFDDGYNSVINNAVPILDSLGYKAVINIIGNFIETGSYMSWENLTELKNRNWQIGSHSTAHDNYKDLSAAERTADFQNMINVIEGNLSITPTLFTYPYNSHNSTIDDECANYYSMCAGDSYEMTDNNGFLFKSANLTHGLPDYIGLRRMIVNNYTILSDFIESVDYFNNIVINTEINEGFGTLIYDSVNSNNGTISGADWDNDGVRSLIWSEGNHNVTIWSNDSAGNINSSSVSFNIDTTNPTLSNLIWKTTGGFTSTSLNLNQIINEINVTASDTNLNDCYLTIKDSDNTQVVNSIMTNTTSNFTYTSEITLNKAGNWNLSVSCNDSVNNIGVISQIITVNTANLSLINNWFGYAPQKILNLSEITSNINYQFMIYEFEQNITNLSTSWNDMKIAINNSYNNNIKVGINYIINYNLNTSSLTESAKNNISNLIELLNAPYVSTIEYISLEILNPDSYNASQKDLVLNSLATNITSTVNNKFVVFSKNYNSTGLSSSVIQYTTLLYSSPTTQTEFINNEISMFKNNESLNRIYEGISESLKSDLSSYYTNVLKVLRNTPNVSLSISNPFVSILKNNDLIVFNNQTSNLININISEISSGKDIWDSTNNYLIEINSDMNFTVNVSSYSATIIYLEDLDHIQMESLTSAKVYKGASSTSSDFNYSYFGARTSNFALYGANDVMIELFDPNYQRNNFLTYYGWINASYVSRNDFCSYEILILADKNNPELDALVGNCSSEIYIYMSVADYSDGDQDNWYKNKTDETDNILLLNGSLNVFIDGLDAGIGGTNFTSRMNDLVNYIQSTKGRKAILNTYTAYETFATLGTGGVMKESCVNRWNGPNAAAPDNYSREDWSLELNKSRWYNSHNVKVLCQSFNNRTTDGTFIIRNYTELQDIYFASKVLGYDYFYLSQPDFNYAYMEYLYNVGNDLSNSWETDDQLTYYRKYSNGIVYYNSTSGHGWIEDGRVINNATICFDLYDAHANAVNFKFTVNNPQPEGDNGDYTISDGNLTLFDWKNVCWDVTGTTNGRYLVEAWASPRTTLVGQGLNIGYTTNSTKSKHSFYDSSTADAWTPYNYGQDWNVNVFVNETKKTSIDTTNKIIQTESNNYGKYYMNLSSVYSFPIEIWSNPFIINYSSFVKLYFKNSTGGWSNLSILNTSTCDSDNPTFSSTIVDSLTHKACYENNGNLTFRISAPSLSTREYYVSTDNTPPNATLLYPINGTYNSTISQNFTINASDDIGLSNGTLFIYNETGEFNQTNFNFVTGVLIELKGILVNLIDGIYNWWAKIWDLEDNTFTTENKTITIDTVLPGINIIYPLNLTYNINISNINYTYTEINPQKCWYSNNSGNWNSTLVNSGTNFTDVITLEGSNTLTVYCNDSASNLNSSSVTFFKDTVFPNINFTNQTQDTGTTILQNFIYMNTSWTEINFKNITFNLFNETDSVNLTTYLTATYEMNFTNLSNNNNIYFYNVTLCDIADNCNSTETRNITLIDDTTNPDISIVEPNDTNYDNYVSGSIKIFSNFSVNDTNLNFCWFNITGSQSISNTLVSCFNGFNNFTFLISTYGSFTIYLNVNDSAGNSNYSSANFTVIKYSGPTGGGGGGISGATYYEYNQTIICSNIYHFLKNYPNYTEEQLFKLMNDLDIALGTKINSEYLYPYLHDFNSKCNYTDFENIPNLTITDLPQNVTCSYLFNESVFGISLDTGLPWWNWSGIGIGKVSCNKINLLKHFFSMDSDSITGIKLYLILTLMALTTLTLFFWDYKYSTDLQAKYWLIPIFVFLILLGISLNVFVTQENTNFLELFFNMDKSGDKYFVQNIQFYTLIAVTLLIASIIFSYRKINNRKVNKT